MTPETQSSKSLRIIGLMSGTSMDGIDAAFIETDGDKKLSFGPFLSVPYAPDFRTRLGRFIESAPDRGCLPSESALEAELTDLHASAVVALLEKMGSTVGDIDLVGFHGQTIWHRPHQKQTWQMGSGEQLAAALSVPVAFDFRTADVDAGGQGAPLAPVFHSALAREMEYPAAVVNIGGVANITWIGSPLDMVAFDTGPGNGLIDDWVRLRCGKSMDQDGVLAARGTPRMDIVEQMTAVPFFDAPPPKSLDRFDFKLEPILPLGVEDGAATLVALTADCIRRSLQHCPAPPKSLLITGGGRRNPTLMAALARQTGLKVEPVEAFGWNGDAVEAQAFAYMAMRCLRGMPITFPGTTGVAAPQSGGRLVRPPAGR